MPASSKLSVYAAILINLNIMIGAGIFINSVALAHYAGFLGFLVYGIVGILLLPLIVSMAQMVNLYPQGGFLSYGEKEINSFAGFLGAWSYFIGKLGSATLLIHTAFLLVQQITPLFRSIPIFILDGAILSLFIALNMLNLRSGKIIQAWLMVLKLVPLFFVIFTGLALFDTSYVTVQWNEVVGLSYCIPLVLYAFLGFEATCSLSNNIENARKNGPIAICVSYALVVALYMTYQLSIFSALGSALGSFESFLGAFPALLAKLAFLGDGWLQKMLNCAVAASALGGSYGILLSNSWNMHTLAQAGYVPGSHVFKKLNTHAIPYASVLLEGAICVLYLLITQGNQIALQLTSVTGSIIAYTISVIGLLYAYRHKNASIVLPRWICMAGLISCLILIAFSIRNIFLFTPWRMAGFFALLLAGIIYFLLYHQNNVSKNTPNCCNSRT